MPRLFTALHIPTRANAELARLKPVGEAVVLQEQPHITLHYIGSVSDELAQDIILALNRVSTRTFQQHIEGMGTFVTARKVHILWAGVDQCDGLLNLHAAIGTCLEALGLPLEARVFKPHITIARLKRPSRAWLDSLVSTHVGFQTSFMASHFTLFASEVINGKSVYRKLKDYDLDN